MASTDRILVKYELERIWKEMVMAYFLGSIKPFALKT
jgi:hypothetical protein